MIKIFSLAIVIRISEKSLIHLNLVMLKTYFSNVDLIDSVKLQLSEEAEEITEYPRIADTEPET